MVMMLSQNQTVEARFESGSITRGLYGCDELETSPLPTLFRQGLKLKWDYWLLGRGVKEDSGDAYLSHEVLLMPSHDVATQNNITASGLHKRKSTEALQLILEAQDQIVSTFSLHGYHPGLVLHSRELPKGSHQYLKDQNHLHPMSASRHRDSGGDSPSLKGLFQLTQFYHSMILPPSDN